MYRAVVAVLALQLVVAQECYEKYTKLAGSTKCVRGYNESKWFSDAEAFCQSNRGHLTAIHNAFENAQIHALLVNLGVTSWIGLSNVTSSSPAWTDGTSLEYVNWSPGFPLKLPSGWPCAYVSADSKWRNDADCFQPKGFFCERNRIPSPCDVDFIVHLENNADVTENDRVKHMSVMKQLVENFTFSEEALGNYAALDEEQVRVSNVFCDGTLCEFSEFFTQSSNVQLDYDQLIQDSLTPLHENILEAFETMSSMCYDVFHEPDATTRKHVPLVIVFFSSQSNVSILFTGDDEHDPYSPDWFAECTDRPIVVFTVRLKNGDPQIHRIASPPDAHFDMLKFDSSTVAHFSTEIYRQTRRACGLIS